MLNRNILTFLLVSALMAVSVGGYAVTVEKTANLTALYPDYTSVDLVCEQMPKAAQKNVEFCCEAAFTGELLKDFRHSNIADNHICSGVMKKGYRCRANTGGFVWGEGKWAFMQKANYPSAAGSWNMGFCQILIIKDGNIMPISSKINKSRSIYRALCEKDGKLCIIQAKKVMTCEYFVKCLKNFGVRHALYLDMGKGWNYAWYRDSEGKVKELFPESKSASDYKFRTNWITFYKE